MDKLDRLIAEKRQRLHHILESIARLERDRDIAEAEIAAFEMASVARPVGAAAVARKGRQPGAISADWKRVLLRLYMTGPAQYMAILEHAQAEGLVTDLPNVRDRVRAFIKAGLIEGTPETGFDVTADAASRFGFTAQETEKAADNLLSSLGAFT